MSAPERHPPDRLGGKKQQQRLPEDEDIAVLDPDLLEDEPIDEVDLEGDDVPIRESNSTSSSVGELEALQPEVSSEWTLFVTAFSLVNKTYVCLV